MPATVDVLIPTRDRPEALIMALSGVAGQTLGGLRVIVADQSKVPAGDAPLVRTLQRVIEARGGSIEWHRRSPATGVAEQRHFLLGRARAESVLFLDDDVFMEPWVLEQLLAVLRTEGCGFVGAFPVGLSYRDDRCPPQQEVAFWQAVEFWDGPVRPEAVEPGTPAWGRARLHSAANLYHVAQRLAPGEVRPYKVAWVGACAIYDRAKLLAIGGFSFWSRLPRYHSGEEVLVQNLLMRFWGGAAIMPSGTYHAEVPSTCLNPGGTVDGHALDLLPQMLERYDRHPVGASRA